jgi:hypothetical protein
VVFLWQRFVAARVAVPPHVWDDLADALNPLAFDGADLAELEVFAAFGAGGGFDAHRVSVGGPGHKKRRPDQKSRRGGESPVKTTRSRV